MENPELEKAVRELRQLKRMAEELKEQIGEAEDVVKAELTARNVDQIITDEYKITWKEVASTRLDTKALKDELPEVYARYAVTSRARRFVVS